MKQKLLAIGLFLIIILGSGCQPTIYVSSLTDRNYDLDKKAKIWLFDTEEKSLKLKNFCLTLRKEMESLGFNFVSSEKAEYIMIVGLDETTSTVSGVLPMPTTSQTSGVVGGTYYSGTTSSTTYLPYTRSYTIKKILLTLCDIKKYENEGKVVTVWEGYIGAGKVAYEENVDDCLYTLLQYFGTNFEGQVRVKKSIKHSLQ